MGDRQFTKIVKVTTWRDTIPGNSQQFTVKQLVPGEQLEINALRVQFRVTRALARTPDQADIYISNLAKETRSIMTRPLSVQLDAGYDGVARLLFVGDLHFAMSEEKGATWDTLLQVGDGDRTYNHSRVNRSYRPGTTVRTVLKDAASSMGLALPANLASDSLLDTQFLTGASSFGPARDELTRLLAPYGYSWSIQGGELVIIRDDQVSSTTAFKVDEDHGMIGSPEYGAPPRSGKPPHVRVRMLLYPEILPGSLLELNSEQMHGLFKVQKVTHTGDTHANDFSTTCEITQFSA